MSASLLYVKEHIRTLAAAEPALKVAEITALLKEQYKGLTEAGKQVSILFYYKLIFNH